MEHYSFLCFLLNYTILICILSSVKTYTYERLSKHSQINKILNLKNFVTLKDQSYKKFS